MNGTQFQVMNPLNETINQAQQILGQLEQASEELQTCIADERTWFARYREAQEAYESLENEITSEAVVAAQIKEGPLAGFAATSKAYDIALLRVKLQARDGALVKQWTALNSMRRSYETSQVDLMRAEARLKALLRMAELQNGILRASTI
jgi:hypothetical protein